MADQRKRSKSAWMSAALAVLLCVYAGCYLIWGSGTVQPGTPKREMVRVYKSSLARVFAPAAWVEAHVTQSTVKIAVIRFEGGLFTLIMLYQVEPGTPGTFP